MKSFILDPSSAAGELYSSVIVSPEAIAKASSSPSAINRAIEITNSLSFDKYTRYVLEFYKQGLQVFGRYWGFMDIVTVLNTVGKIGLPENYLEIGVRRGRSLCSAIADSPNTDVYAFDMWQENYAGNNNPGAVLVEEELAKFQYQGRAIFIDGDSKKTVPEFLSAHPELKFDLITVDGDHSVEGAWEDLSNVLPRLSVGGVIVFDDTANPYCPGLNQVWMDLLLRDKSLKGFSYNDLGTGISFAIRTREMKTATIKRPSRLEKFMKSWR